MSENHEPQMTLKFATAKAELNELIETHLLELKVASIGGKKPNINSFSLSVIEDLVQPEFSSKANQWWINEGKLFWRTETHKRNYLYFNPWAIGFLAGWIGTYISFIFFSHLLFTFPVGFAVITGGIYGISIRGNAIDRLYCRIRTMFLSKQMVWKAEKLSKKHPEFKFINIGDFSNEKFLEECLIGERVSLEHFIRR